MVIDEVGVSAQIADQGVALREIQGALGQRLANEPAHETVARGLAHVPEGRMIFANLSVYENLLIGAYLRRDKASFAKAFGTALKRSRVLH